MSFLGIVGFVIYASRHPAWRHSFCLDKLRAAVFWCHMTSHDPDSDSYIPQRSMGYLRSGLALVYSVSCLKVPILQMRSKSLDPGVGCYLVDLLDHYYCKDLRPMGGERHRCSPSQYKKP